MHKVEVNPSKSVGKALLWCEQHLGTEFTMPRWWALVGKETGTNKFAFEFYHQSDAVEFALYWA